jgi:hypothetical protein
MERPNTLVSPVTLRNIIWAAVATIVLSFIPYASLITYPLRLLVTYIHEGSHALMAILTGGIVSGISVHPDGSGLTYSRGGIGVLTSSAGYLGATLFGVLLIKALQKGRFTGNSLLLFTGICVGLVTLGTIPGLVTVPVNPLFKLFGVIVGAFLTLCLVVASRKLSANAANATTAFIGVQCVLNALLDIQTLLHITTTTGGHSDAQNMQNATLIPAPFWAILWGVLALGMLWWVLRPAAWKR